MMLIGNIFVFSAFGLGEQTDFTEDYEDEAVTQTTASDSYYGYTWVTTWDTNDATDGIVDNTHANSGTKSFKSGRNGYNDGGSATDTYINISGGNILSNFSWWSYWDYDSGTSTNGGGEIYHFYSQSTEMFSIHHKRIGTSDPQRRFYYKDVSGWNTAFNCYGNEWNHFWINRNANDSFTFYRYSATAGSVGSYTGSILAGGLTEYGNITQVHIENWGGDGGAYLWKLWTDDISIEITSPDAEEENATIPPCTPYETLGELNGIASVIRGTSYKYMWCVYGVQRKMYVKRLDLEIDVNMGDLISNTHVRCKVNEYNLGNANTLVQISDNSYRLSWTGLNVLVNNTPTAISFYFMQTFGTGSNRNILPLSITDINEDGYSFCVYYNDDGYYNNHGQHIYDRPYTVGSTTSSLLQYDPIIRLCIEELANAELDTNLNNSILCVPNTIKVGQYTKIAYTVNDVDFSSNMYINVQKHGSSNYSHTKVNTQSSYVSYTPLEEGTFYANLSIDGSTKATDTFTVTGSLDDYLYTYPNPSLPNQQFLLYYNYSKSDYGSIRIFDNDNNLVQSFPIDPNSNGTLIVTLKEGAYVMKLMKIVDTGSGNAYVSVFDYPHSVFTNQIAFINVDPKATPLDYPVLIWGQHSHVGQNVIVKMGETVIKNVGNENQFSFYQYSTKEGAFDLELILVNEDNSQIVLDSTTVTFNSGLYDDLEQDWFRNILDSIPDFYKVIGGLIITIIGFLAPYIVLINMNENRKVPVQFNIPGVISLACGLMASGICTYVGLYGWEFLAICMMVIVVGVFIMFYHKQSGGGD
jgi:hypothetical protein